MPLNALIFVPSNAFVVPRDVANPDRTLGQRSGEVVVHSVGMRDFFETDLRLLRASLLYADDCEVASVTQFVNARRDMAARFGGLGVIYGSEGFSWLLDQLAELTGGGGDSIELPVAEAERAKAVLGEFQLAIDAGALRVPNLITRELVESPHPYYDEMVAQFSHKLTDVATLPVIQDLVGRARTPSPSTGRQIEATLATGVLGSLAAFPDASMDVILDVRERLRDARGRFQTEISRVARDLAVAETAVSDAGLVRDLRTQVIDPAVEEMETELDDLGAKSTLLRLSSNRATVSAASAEISLAVSSLEQLGSIGTIARGALSVPLVAAVADEIRLRRDARAATRQRPYWFVREVDRLLRKRP